MGLQDGLVHTVENLQQCLNHAKECIEEDVELIKQNGEEVKEGDPNEIGSIAWYRIQIFEMEKAKAILYGIIQKH